MDNNENGSYNVNSAGMMFDPAVIQEIHKRHEIRVRDVQDKVSTQFEDLKCLGRALWKAQKFEDLIFGRLKIPFELLNNYIKTLKTSAFMSDLVLGASPSGDLMVSFRNSRLGLVLLTLGINDIIFGKKYAGVTVVLKSWELPEASWLTRNLIKLGIMKTGLDTGFLNQHLGSVKFHKGKARNEYRIDCTDTLQSLLNENEISLDMVRLLGWEIFEGILQLQISINTERLSAYLKRRMPILFD